MNFFNKCISYLFPIILLTCSLIDAKAFIVPTGFPKIQNALDKAEEGDTVYVASGTYKENLTMPDGILLTGEDAGRTIIKGNRQDPVVKAANNSIIENFSIIKGGIGILSENTNMIIRNNIIRDNFKTGIQCVLSLPHIQNNIIVHNKWSGVYCELVAYGTRTAIEHNIIADNENTGIMLSRESGVLVQNNVIFRNNQYGINVTKDSRKSRIIYNNFYLNRRGYNNHAIVDATNVSVDPKFPMQAWSSFSFLDKYESPTSARGKNGAPIGILNNKELENLFKDSDEDSIGDKLDACPDVREDMDNFEDDDGCPEKDNDLDGILDFNDRCPNDAEDYDGYNDRDGCPDEDNDQDKVPDLSDRCPSQKETINGYQDQDGCPDEVPENFIPDSK